MSDGLILTFSPEDFSSKTIQLSVFTTTGVEAGAGQTAGLVSLFSVPVTALHHLLRVLQF